MSDDGFITLSNEFKHLEDDYMKLGKMYNEWKNKYGEHLSINYVDPKNVGSVASYLFKQAQAGMITYKKAILYLFTKIKLNAIFVNGYYLENIDDFDKIVKQTHEVGVKHG
ncbi:hypothetical protein [Piscibacillus salipiscarius]|uniref:Uncharacterized protein n=1 Tax=Piscibacillus salipiscarius TaxID=299480 RepID=A0ABW5QDP3_9BACI